MLNPDLDRRQLAEQWAVDGRVRIENILDADVAERVHTAMRTKVPFRYVYNYDGKNHTRTHDEMTAMTPEQFGDLQKNVMSAASRGIGYYYCGYTIGHRDTETQDEDLQFLNSIFD